MNDESPWLGRGFTRLKDGHVMCCICFEYRRSDELFVDIEGDTWDFCKGKCAESAWKSEFRTLFHGTHPAGLERIQAHGLTAPPGVSPAGWLMLTDSYEQASAYANGGPVIEYHVPEALTDYRHPKGVLWPGREHDVYGQKATAYGVKGALPGKYIARVHPPKSNG
ncbi:MAG: hypothetical protein ACOH1Y_09305 [Propionicimonas sp.]